MKLMKQLDIVSLLLWCILLFNLIENITSYYPCLDSIEGPVIYPNDTQFPPLIIDQNIRVNYTPSVLVYAINNNDVKKAVTCAIKSGTDIVPRSGGHSYEKYGLGGRDNMIVLDVSFINVVTVDSKGETAKIGAGNRLGDVYNKLSQAGFLIPAGSCPSVGVGGHALGGGVGYFSRRYGLACDNIISMEMVDAKGNLLNINSKKHRELFFALRGAGGGSYGIVTYFVFRIHRKPPKVTYMSFEFNRKDMTAVRQLFYAFNKVGPSLVDDIGLKLRLRKNLLSISGVYLGSPSDAKNAMKKFLYYAPNPINPIGTRYKQKTFIESVETLSNITKYNVFSPKHSPNFFKVKSFYINKGEALSKTAINVLVDYLNKAKCRTLASFDLYGGAINNVHKYKTSFIHRNALYCLQLEAGWDSKEQDDQCVKEINDFGKKFQSKFTSRFSYQGFIDRELDNWQERYYGDIFGKLIDIKKEYDSCNLFKFPQSIPVRR